MQRLILLGAALCLTTAVHADAGTLLVIDTKESAIKINLVHKLHEFSGASHRVAGKALLLPTGQAQVEVHVPSESFDTGNVNRDAHMKEAIEAARFTTVDVKAIGGDLALPAKFPAVLDRRFKAQLSFHGVQQVFEVPVRITFESASRVRAVSSFAISLDSFKVERPSLLFVKLDDELRVEATLLFKGQ